MIKRLIGGAIIAIVVVPCFIFGGIIFDLLANLVGILALIELIHVDKDLKRIPAAVKTLSLVLIPFIAYSNFKESLYMGIGYNLVAIAILSLLLLSLAYHKYGFGSKEAFKLGFLVIFIGLVTNFYVNIFHMNKWLFLWLVIIAIATDVFAYLGGMLIGKHKFTKISPNKTIEGCVVGTLFGTAIGCFYYMKLFVVNNVILIIGVTLLLSIIGQLGDLFFSLIKRDNDIKDFSNTIPGHGGICDRIDSLTFIIILFVVLFRYL